ncbi:MFS transporter, partial [Mycobacterium tuberculosis]|nr:MFS transporter [Mycobacterium tuberculosis]
SGMAQSVGYLLAACGPPLMGRIHDANGDWHIPLLAVALISLVMAFCGAPSTSASEGIMPTP